MRAPDRRRQLLEVAADLFARHGYRGTTTARLAEAAGITEPILYRHFENKQDLFLTLVEEVGDRVVEAWSAALEGEDDPRRRLATIIGGNPATDERGRVVYRVIFRAMTEADDDPAIARIIRRHLRRLHGFLAEELADLQARGAVRGDRDADELAWLLVCVATGYGLLAPLGRGRGFRPIEPAAIRELMESLVGA